MITTYLLFQIHCSAGLRCIVFVVWTQSNESKNMAKTLSVHSPGGIWNLHQRINHQVAQRHLLQMLLVLLKQYIHIYINLYYELYLHQCNMCS